jgi:hypothetical protein
MENSIFNSWRMENAGLTSDETVVAEVSGVQRFAPDSPLEGDGFELLVRGRGEAGCRAF